MSKLSDNVVIDLTNSFTLVSHCGLTDMVIDLVTDDSIIDINTSQENNSVESNLNDSYLESNKTQPKKKRKSQNRRKSINKENIKQQGNNNTTRSNKFGECPICWEGFGKNPVASTKCGHVYCIKCLENSLKVSKKCPTCRCVLKGNSAYHPLYF